ncbi:hypothetical protein O181_094295 [Austropuccinia psidii MF-1]|uniref:Uncharacterized protein n=1 Tax=Austropuccinia psidii MF-1 TaxID=1389203 RepID=A0A9Q3J1U5_9BASI|nr:hypothetical protein [Austropuccinia psidii MF-1]
MSFDHDKCSVDKDPYQWCLTQCKILKAIEPQMNTQVRNHKLLTQLPREQETALKFKCNQNCTLDDIANTLQDIRKGTNIGKLTPYKRSGFKEKQPFRVELKDKPKERGAEVAKKKNSCHNWGSKDHYDNNCPKAKKKVYSIEKFLEQESPTEDSESDSMGDAIREPSDYDQDPRKHSSGIPRGNPTRNSGDTVGSRDATGHCQQKLVQTYTRCTNIPGHTNQRNGIYTSNSHKNDCLY